MTIKAKQALKKMAGGKLTLGKAIKSIRLCNEDKQGDFAKKLKVTQSYLSDLENNRKEVSPQKAVEFAKILQQSETQFVRLALQDALYRQGLYYEIDVRIAA